MEFVICKDGSSFSDSEKQKARLEVEHRSSQWEENKECASATTVGPVSKQLYLKSCSKASSQGLDKQLVLRRIRHRKSLNKVKSAFEALLGSSQSQSSPQFDTLCLQQHDAFSDP